MYVYNVFLRLPSCRQSSTRWCVVLSPTCLGISDWRVCVLTRPSWPRCSLRRLLTDLTAPPALLSSSPRRLFPRAAWRWHGLVNACYCHFKSPKCFCTSFSCLPPCGLCKLIFLFHWRYWHFVFIGCKSWLKWLYLMMVVLLWVYGTPEI